MLQIRHTVWDKLLGKLLRGIFLLIFLRSILRIHSTQQLHMKSRNHEYVLIILKLKQAALQCAPIQIPSQRKLG